MVTSPGYHSAFMLLLARQYPICDGTIEKPPYRMQSQPGGFSLSIERVVELFDSVKITRFASCSCSPLNHYVITSAIREEIPERRAH